MSYPTITASCKHDLYVPRLPPPPQTLLEAFGLHSTPALFQKLSEAIPQNLKQLSSLYSYPDGPQPPLSSALFVIGVIPEHHAVLRKLVGDDEDETDKCLHKCSLAVKRADGRHADKLAEKYLTNAKQFAQFVQRLRQEGVVAVLGQDKFKRMGILKPYRVFSDEGYHENDFHVACFVGVASEVQDALIQAVASSASVPTAASAPDAYESGDPVWQPDDEPSGNSNGTSEPLWQPEDTETKSASAGLWEAPSSDGANSSGLWEPSSTSQSQEASGLWEPASSSQGKGTSGLWEPAVAQESGGFGGNAVASEWEQPNVRKRGREEEIEQEDTSKKFHDDTGAAAADNFYSNLTRDQGTRADSRLYHMRSFNGWVKATQIQELDPKTKGPKGKIGGPLRILDLACGKGGDLTKWTIHPRGIANYVGIDVARGSLRDAAERARKIRHKLKHCTFSCADLGKAVPGRWRSSKHKHMQKLLTWSLQNESVNETQPPDFSMIRGGGIQLEDRFDVVSIQFAIHYMMSTKMRARRFFRTVSQLLDVGGNLIATTIDARVIVSHLMNLGLDLHFDDSKETPNEREPVIRVGGGACRLTFEPHIVKQIFQDHVKDDELPESLFGLEYTFNLVEGSDHGAGVGDAVNLPEWLTPIPVLVALAKEVGLELEYAQNFHEFYAKRSDPSTHASSHSSLYNMKVLNRNGSISGEEWEISRLYMAIKFRKVREPELTPLSDDDDGEEEDDIDAAANQKLMTMALLKAKKAAGNKVWDGLTAEEKTQLTEVERKKLAIARKKKSNSQCGGV